MLISAGGINSIGDRGMPVFIYKVKECNVIKFLMPALCVSCFLLSGCWGSVNYYHLFDAGKNAVQGATVNEDELKKITLQMRQHMDTSSKVSPDTGKYTTRLKKIMAQETSVNGVPLNYKVYVNPELNADATPDGSIRVNTGLMDAMNDDELRFVLGHEIGHVAHGHSLNAMRMAYATAAAKSGVSAINPYAAMAAQSGLGDLAREFLHAQYSQSQELDADAYGMDFLKNNNRNPKAALSAMRKLGLSGGGFFSSHPSGERRLKNLEALENGADPKTLSTTDKK